MQSLRLPDSDLLSAHKSPGTPTVVLVFENGASRTWLDCGAATAYMQAKDTLSKTDFEKFAMMQASFSVMASGPVAQKLYPAVAALHPEGHVDVRLPEVKAHMQVARQLDLAVRARRVAINAMRAKPVSIRQTAAMA